MEMKKMEIPIIIITYFYSFVTSGMFLLYYNISQLIYELGSPYHSYIYIS